jgi:hypothetical protein
MKTYVFSTFTVLLLMMCSSLAWGQRNMQQRSKVNKPTKTVLVEQKPAATTPEPEPVNTNMYNINAASVQASTYKGPQQIFTNVCVTLTYQDGSTRDLQIGGQTSDCRSHLVVSARVSKGWTLFGAGPVGFGSLSAIDKTEIFNIPPQSHFNPIVVPNNDIFFFSGENFQGTMYSGRDYGIATGGKAPLDILINCKSYISNGVQVTFWRKPEGVNRGMLTIPKNIAENKIDLKYNLIGQHNLGNRANEEDTTWSITLN